MVRSGASMRDTSYKVHIWLFQTDWYCHLVVPLPEERLLSSFLKCDTFCLNHFERTVIYLSRDFRYLFHHFYVRCSSMFCTIFIFNAILVMDSPLQCRSGPRAPTPTPFVFIISTDWWDCFVLVGVSWWVSKSSVLACSDLSSPEQQLLGRSLIYRASSTSFHMTDPASTAPLVPRRRFGDCLLMSAFCESGHLQQLFIYNCGSSTLQTCRGMSYDGT